MAKDGFAAVRVATLTDTPQCLTWSNDSSVLAVGCWDGMLYVYQVDETAGIAKKAAKFKHPKVVLDVTAVKDGFVTGCADGNAYLCTVGSPKPSVVAKHDGPVSSVAYMPSSGCLLTGSWDETVALWDMRGPDPVGRLQINGRVQAMDAKGTTAVVLLTNRQLCVLAFDPEPRLVDTTAVAMPSGESAVVRDITLTCNEKIAIVATMEGRCAVHPLSERVKEYTFKCHRPTKTKDIYPVNAVACHPTIPNVFVTVGSDSALFYWDPVGRQRLQRYESVLGSPLPITCCGFNPSGSLLALGAGYDWAKGYESYSAAISNEIYIKAVADTDVTSREKAQKR
eukprot:m.292255 g.292255  ORF g.292255 m.292255 type:complete len:339 (+) comp17825_c0_seq2:66-1082(+)